ncbi:MAG: helix-turn-helix transcriptional regulator [Deltaproteobacteria bacterium]|nr:helix-turn-helix transcriptional regulator [Deltaproteobacteria bacterium]
MRKINKKNFEKAKDHIKMTPGEMLVTLRKLQDISQNDLSEMTGMSQSNISNMESGRQQIGRDRALVLAQALKVHPSVILFPDYQMDECAV